MPIIIRDNRIGYKDKNGSIVQRPTYYVTGEFWSREAVLSPTTVFFGFKSRFFYILPVSVSRIRSELKIDLTIIANEYAPEIFPDEYYAETNEKGLISDVSTGQLQNTHEYEQKTVEDTVSEQKDDSLNKFESIISKNPEDIDNLIRLLTKMKNERLSGNTDEEKGTEDE